jgi:D-alanyl-D-alanine carboxypeptidase/D-alanyl-D-alanine-endopeptidase (penicillin-binding protein 4)
MTVARSVTRRSVVAVAMLVVLAACSSTPAASVREARSSPVPSHVEPSPAVGVLSPPAPTAAAPIISEEPSRAAWTDAIDAAIDGRDVSVAVGVGSRIMYAHLGRLLRIPASNQKLLTSMAALDEWGPSFRFRTVAGARKPPLDGVLRGDLWIIGSGDPEISRSAMARLASRLRAGGLTRVVGSVMGDTGAFTREWWAPGWVPGLSRRYVTRATALAFDGNEGIGLPELAAASALTAALESVGVRVDGAPDAREAPQGVVEVGGVRSAPLHELLAIIDGLPLEDYRYLHSARAELLRRVGRTAEARGALQRALALVHDYAERRLLERRMAELEDASAAER